MMSEAGSGEQPAQYGYEYTTRDETPGEYRSRTGMAASAAALVPGGTYRLLASYAENDHKFGGDATSDVDSDVPLPREEAQRLAEDAIDADARRQIALIYPNDGSEMEVRPSLSSLSVIRLLDLAPPVAPATSLTGPALDEFAQRYAASRGLTPDDRGPAWRDPGPWFLATTDITRSRGPLRGTLGGGPFGEFWYAEGAVQGPRRSREQWAVARYESMQARRAGGIACMPRQWPRTAGILPRGLLAIATGDDAFDKLFAVGAAGGEPVTSGPSWAQRIFPAGLTAWLLAQPYGEEGADATGFQVQGGLLCVYSRGWPATAESLDAFCDRAAKIAAAIEEATRIVR